MIKKAVAGAGLLVLVVYLLTRKAEPAKKYSCSGTPDYTCRQDVNGTYNTLIDCQNACSSLNQIIEIIVNEATESPASRRQ